MKKTIFYVYSNKAYYPELEAYRDYFSDMFHVEIIEKKNLKQKKYDKNTILWFIMGFYPERYNAGLIIHDYRSLSVGMFPKIKNFLKKYINQQPNIRIFLNETIANEMNFKDKVPEIFIDMGVPEKILKNKETNKNSYQFDFIYVGDISFERETDKLIEKFQKKHQKKTLMLVGTYEELIFKEYHTYENVFFTGRLPQYEVFNMIQKSEFALNFIPNKYPYSFQTSTKLLEYASLGKKIITSFTQANKITLEKYKINSLIVDDYNFPDENELKKIVDNNAFEVSTVLWKKIIEESNIEYLLLQ
ncbi:hypothetical protein TSL6_13510 [Sulfurovum sp. TSL6]|uniref:hypothetical protein n=1 Tax=Sulfurovum sp. TSL6 TaxID=2826995 RepID=UPI001CC63A4F|nr:hypothetical protein [Sulfurovum sp. TSL6]GIU00845.1 hypothetical protein TSL6_13510 [Sulfurovum sp. TSL6]